MARKKVQAKVEAVEDVDQLRELVADDSNGIGMAETPHSRRGLLKMAGAALAGAAGVAALRVIPAAAATGSAVLQGCYNFESIDAPTYLIAGPTAANTEAGTSFIGRGSTGIRGAGYWAADHTQEVGVFGISKGDTINGTAGGSGTGVVGLAGSGRGTAGVSSTGSGLFGVSGSGLDAQLGFPVVGGVVGTGRLGMVGRTDVGGVGPSWAPAFQVTSTFTYTFQHELVRGNDGSIWASRFDAGSAPTSKRWKRINTVRTDTADGAGAAFKPVRVLDTRSGAIKAAGSVTTITIAGFGTGASAIPTDAIAVMGNLTAAGYTGGGFLTIMPAGITVGTGAGQYNPSVDPSSVNFIVGQYAIANSFVCGLRSGQLEVYVGGPPLPGHSSHFILDITAYLQ